MKIFNPESKVHICICVYDRGFNLCERYRTDLDGKQSLGCIFHMCIWCFTVFKVTTFRIK